MRILTGIFTRHKNLEYFRKCLEHWQISCKNLEKFPENYIDLLVIDFGKQQSEEIEGLTKEYGGRYHFKRESGFGSNVNSTFNYAVFNGHEFVCLLNDDVFIGRAFLSSGVEFLLGDKRVGFVGGKEGAAKGWLTPIDAMHIPPAENRVYELEDFRRLFWEFSACILRREAIEESGHFDTYGDPTGYCCDNAYLLMMKKAGWSVWHSDLMPFAHHRGLSQQEHRLPGGDDPIRDKMIDYLKREYGIDITDNIPITHLKDGFPLSQNKRAITFWDLNIMLKECT